MNDLITLECKEISYEQAADYLRAIADVERRLKAMKAAIKTTVQEAEKAGKPFPPGVWLSRRAGLPAFASNQELWDFVRDNNLMDENEFRKNIKIPYKFRGEILKRMVKAGIAPTQTEAGYVFDREVTTVRTEPVEYLEYDK